MKRHRNGYIRAARSKLVRSTILKWWWAHVEWRGSTLRKEKRKKTKKTDRLTLENKSASCFSQYCHNLPSTAAITTRSRAVSVAVVILLIRIKHFAFCSLERLTEYRSLVPLNDQLSVQALQTVAWSNLDRLWHLPTRRRNPKVNCVLLSPWVKRKQNLRERRTWCQMLQSFVRKGRSCSGTESGQLYQ